MYLYFLIGKKAYCYFVICYFVILSFQMSRLRHLRYIYLGDCAGCLYYVSLSHLQCLA